MIDGDAVGEHVQQRSAARAGGEEKLFEVPRFTGRDREAFGVEHHLDGLRTQIESSVEAAAACEREQLCLAPGGVRVIIPVTTLASAGCRIL